jgi:hypothetical protein
MPIELHLQEQKMSKSFVTSLIIALVLVLTLGGATNAAVSQSDYNMMKTKIAAGEHLSQSDINTIIELHNAGMSVVDAWELGQLKEYGRIGERPASVRPPHSALDEYVFSTITYNFYDIEAAPGRVELPGMGDDVTLSPYNLGFAFPFYDGSMTAISICSNGYVSNTANTTADWTNNPIPDVATPNPVIAPFWDDLYPGNTTTPGHVFFWADPSGTRAIVQWEHCVGNLQAGPGPQTLQVQLFSNGNIEFHYETINGGDSCTVGIENNTGTAGLQVAFNGTGTRPASGTAIRINQPNGVPNPVTNVNAVQNGTNVDLTWTNPTHDTNGNVITPGAIQVWVGPPTTGTLLATLGGTVSTYTHVNAPSGNITYYVRAYLNPYYGAAGSDNIIVGNPSYNENFNASTGMWVVTSGEAWEWGAPTPPPAPHSAPNLWGTYFGEGYTEDLLDATLDLPIGLTINSATASIEFWAWWETETGFDGCNMKISTDGGSTWTVLAPTGGYPDTISTNFSSPIAGEAAWTGSLNPQWVYVTIPLAAYVGQAPIFRFHFATDNSANGYAGFYFDDMVIWGLSAAQYAPVSGTVTLDGGAGPVTAATVHANGLGNPTATPAANGTYTMAQVLVGNRTVWASLAGYHDATTTVNVPIGGSTNVNLTLVRLDPPVPTGLEAEVSNTTGIATLTWTASTDPLVDRYNIYRRLQGDANYVNIGFSTTTTYDDNLTTPGSGIYQYAISAVDLGVSTPVESELTAPVTVLYGELPPSGLGANGEFDSKIVLDWFEPGTPPEFELFYDNGVDDFGGLGFWGGSPTFGWMVTKFVTTGGPISITKLKMFITSDALEGDNFQIGVFADEGGTPTFTPLGVMDITQEGPFDAWFEWTLPTPVTLPNGIAWIGNRQITAFQGVSVGGDTQTPMPTNTFKYSYDGTAWTSFEPNLVVIPLQRCFAIGQFGAVVELEPAPFEVEPLPATTTVSKAGKKMTSVVTPANWMTSTPDHRYDFKSLVARGASAVAAHAPNISIPANRDHGNSLDEVLYYIVYRRPTGTGAFTDIGHPTTEHFENTGIAENVSYDYKVTAYYDNSQESGPTETVTESCNMAPAAPTNLTVVSVPPSSAFLTWIDPIANADGTPCVDLANIRVFRDGVQVGSVAAGVHQYTDNPTTAGYYIWTVRAIDEVPNVSELSNEAGGIAGNPSYFSDFNTDNGGWEVTSGDSWEWGAPTPPPDAYSAPNVWANYLSGGYTADLLNSTLDLDPGVTINQATASIEFWAFWDFEDGFDGCNMKISTDGGATWEIVTPDGGYPYTISTAYQSPIAGEDAWSGFVEEWTYVSIPLAAYVGQMPIFRFHFATDASANGYLGFFFDDLVIWGGGPSGEIAGLVREMGTNVPIAGADVTVLEAPTAIGISGADGTYTLSVEPGTYTVTAHKQGYCDVVNTGVVVEDGNTTTRNFSMLQPAGVVDVTSINMQTSINVNVSRNIVITNPGAGCPYEFEMSADETWLSFNPVEGQVAANGSQTVVVTATVAGMATGQHTANVSIENNDTNSPLIIPVVLDIFVSADDPHSIPTEFAFFQNYPNPFNATTALSFDVPVEANVEIAIFNVMGQEVARPVNGNFPAGHHKIMYTADGLPSGMYLVKMTAGGFSGLQKMVLLK